MSLSRRRFLSTVGVGAGAVGALELAGDWPALAGEMADFGSHPLSKFKSPPTALILGVRAVLLESHQRARR